MTSNKGKLWPDHKYQLTAYAFLVEEAYHTTVMHGIVDYVNENLVVKCEITDGVKRYALRIIAEISKLISDQAIPPITVPFNKCLGGCGYLWICGRR